MPAIKKLLVVLVLCSPAMAQLWSGILDPTRATDWSGAGASIVNRSTICATFNPGATAAQIQAQLQNVACQNKVVKLNAGTYTLAAGLDFGGNPNVTLRGAGPNSTFIQLTAGTNHNCNGFGQFSGICMTGADQSYYGPGPPPHIFNWTAGYAQGTTSITLSGTTGLSVGTYLILDACNTGFSGASCTGTEGINANDMVNCQKLGTCTDEDGGSTPQRTKRAQRDAFRVTSVAGNVVTLDHGLRHPNWAALNSLGTGTVQAWWGNSGSLSSGQGVEDLSIDGTNIDANAGNIVMIFVVNDWVKNVRSTFGPNPRAHVVMYQCIHCTVRDSYFYGSQSEASGPTHYGLEFFPCFDCLIENNIFQRRTTPFIMDGSVGSVIAYNYAVNDQYTVASFMQATYYSHEGGNYANLMEGNIGPGFKADVVHASSNMTTLFRSYMIGWEPGKSGETGAVKLYALNRFYNLVGNVLGRQSYFTSYESTNNACSDLSVYTFGCKTTNAPSDAYVGTSVMRWGNYAACVGTNCQTTRFVAGEVPSGLAKYANAVPADTNLPSSFYLSSKPSWFGSLPWPGIGPDVTTGSINASNGSTAWVAQPLNGHANPNAAQKCYETTMGGPADGTGSVLPFDGGTCYPLIPLPSPPTGLSAVVH